VYIICVVYYTTTIDQQCTLYLTTITVVYSNNTIKITITINLIQLV
jgi:hypothetical protein